MNFLAHFHLAAAHDDWLVGALLGDFIKGPLRGDWPAGWEEGIRLHRLLDARSDQLPQRREAALALPPELRRYAGILFDLYSDYWLSRHWEAHSDEPLPRFSDRVYALLASHQPRFPGAAQRFSDRLRRHDLLNRYDDWTVIEGALASIGERLRRPNPLPTAGKVLLAQRERFDACCAAEWEVLPRVVADFAQGRPG